MLKRAWGYLGRETTCCRLLVNSSGRSFSLLSLHSNSLRYYSTNHSNKNSPNSFKTKNEAEFRTSRKQKRSLSFPVPEHSEHDSGVSLPQSLDRSERESLIDVEKYFPLALKHLRSSPKVPEVEEDRMKRHWDQEVHYLNVDGIQIKTNEKTEGAKKSFFDQRSLDIRKSSESLRQKESDDTTLRAERTPPDILRITGGTPQEHGLNLSTRSNEAPADATMEKEGDLDENRNGDTSMVLTDMLKERMEELKVQKLREDRFTSYVPRRLNLASDAAVARAKAEKKKLLQEKIRRKPAVKTATPSTLVDLAVSAGIEEEGDDTVWNSSKSSSLEGVVSDDGCLNAKEFLQRITSSVPGLASRSQRKFQRLHRREEGEGEEDKEKDGVYLLRTLPRAGFCSRREAELVISSGKVRVNNVVERNPFRLVRAQDDIHVAGHQFRLRFAPPRLWLYHKPAHVIVSRHDVAGRVLITKHAAILGMDHLIPVGSLPMRSHGALLLTNDGELSRFLEDPSSMIQQTYLLRVRPSITPILAHKLNTKGIYVNHKHIQGVEFIVNPSLKSRFSVKVKAKGDISLPIYELMRHLGRTIERGGRIAVGPFSLGNLSVGSIREVTVPPHYTEHAGRDWTSFVERDGPYFRRRRILKLRKISHFRELTPKEVKELENAAYTEIQDSMKLEASELDAATPMVSIPSRPLVEVPFSSTSVSLNGLRNDDSDAVDTLSSAFIEPEVLADITDVEHAQS